MIENIYKKFLKRKKQKPFSAWQIELTTRCPLKCKMCIRSGSVDWQSKDMAFEDFKKIVPYLKDVDNVILEGWGESLLYNHLLECIQMVKKEGPQVGFVTSGKGLTENRISELIEAGIDFIGFSIAGVNPETHEKIRVNSSLSEILNAIRFFIEEKRRRRVDCPKIHFVFLMLKDNIDEIPKLPTFAKSVGVYEIFLTNIIHITNYMQDLQKVFSYREDVQCFDKLIKDAEINAKRLGIKLKRPSLFPRNVAICEENPIKNLYISSNGEVSPCIYLNPPLESPFKRIFYEEEHLINRVSFGNIFKEPFLEIWNKDDYINFRNNFIAREKEFRNFSFSLLNTGSSKLLKEVKITDPPLPCLTCHKMLGF